MKKCLLALLLASFTPSVVCGGAYLRDYRHNPDGGVFTAGFTPDAGQIIVGEPVFLTFSMTNRSPLPYKFSRVNNSGFSITAHDANGVSVKSTYSGLNDSNGAVRNVSIEPGKTFTARIFLNERCVFDKPGTYTVTAKAYLDERNPQPPAFNWPLVTFFKLTVLPADPKSVKEVIEKWGRAVKTNGNLWEAAQALAEINDPRTIPHLAALAAKGVQPIQMVWALSKYKGDAAADALKLVLLHSAEYDYAAVAAGEALRKAGQEDRIARALLPELSDADAKVRIKNALALSWTGSKLAFEPLCALLKDKNNSVRYAAADYLGRLKDTRSHDVLIKQLNDPDFALRVAAVTGLHALGETVQLEWVKPIILSGASSDEYHRTYYDAIKLLEYYGGKKAARGLASCINFNDPSLRHSYNMDLILALEATPDGPKYYYKWHGDPGKPETEEALNENRHILSEIKKWLNAEELRTK